MQAADDVKYDNKASNELDCKVMKNPHIIIVGIADYDFPNDALHTVQDDIRKMKNLWKTKFKYPNVAILGENNIKITVKQLNSFLNDEAAKIQCHKRVDGIIFIYSGHGSNDGFGENYIVCSGNGRLPLTEIQEKFNMHTCDYLEEFPKLLYLDCCRGKQKIEDESTRQIAKGNAAKKRYVNNLSDFMMHYATAQNYVAWSNEKKGGHLINAIYKCYNNEFEKHKKADITLHETSMKLNQMVCMSNKGKQTAEIINRLTYDVYIKPYGANADVLRNNYTVLRSKYNRLKVKYKKDVEKLQIKVAEMESKMDQYMEHNRELQTQNLILQQRLSQPPNNEFVEEQPPLPSIPESIFQDISMANDVDTWEDKNVRDWSCQELQSWIRSLGFQDTEVVDLLTAVHRTNTNGREFAKLQNAKAIHDRFLQHGFNISENVSSVIVDQLSCAIVSHDQESENNGKSIEEWNCHQLQSWIKVLGIKYSQKKILIQHIDKQGLNGEDMSSCESAQDILNSFPGINEYSATIVFEGIQQRASH